MRYWDDKGQRAYGKELADRVPVTRRLKRKKMRPTAEGDVKFEKQLRKEEPRVRSVLQVGLGLGLRSEELLSMRREVFEDAVQWGQLTVRGKGFKERVLDAAGVRAALVEMLSLPANQPHVIADRGRDVQWQCPGHLLARADSSLATQRHMLARHIKAVAKRAGLDSRLWSPHTLRHVFATRMFRDGAPLGVIQVALGHESIETTMRYIGVTPEDVAKYMRRIR